jgi:hypothetical protein
MKVDTRGLPAVLLVLALCQAVSLAPARAANPQDRIFTVAKYPVDATAANAVTAKREALDEGRKAALRSLLKRLVPGEYHDSIPALLAQADATALSTGLRVVSEENSATQYIATLDFSFSPDGVRGLLQSNGLPFVDQPAPATVLLPLYVAPGAEAGAAMVAARGAATWRGVWSGLDLANALAPLDLAPAREPAADVRDGLRYADPQAVATAAQALQTAQLVIAEARPDPAAGKLFVTLAGQDAAGRFALTTAYQLDREDFRYSLELAAVVSQGILEGRWKAAIAAPARAAGPVIAGGAPMPLQLVAEFASLAQWQRQQQVLAGTPGVTDLRIGGVTGRSASIALVYPGGGPALQAAIGPRGLSLENINGFWVLR